MNLTGNILRRQNGASMIEVLVTLVILLVGLLGLAGLQMQAQRSEMESYQRAQALILLEDMVGRINANRQVASCYATTSLSPAYLGTNTAGTAAVTAPNCSAGTTEQNARATQDMIEWSNLLYGAAEAGNTGAMLGGRGCVSFNAASGVGMVSVVWQGLGETVAQAANSCAVTNPSLYGSNEKRRVITAPFTIGCLSCS